METVIIVPVLGRPHHVEPLLRNIREQTPEPHRILWIADPDDRPELDALDEAMVQPEDVLLVGGSYGKKINLGISASVEPLIFTAADDLLFHSGWLEEAKKLLSEKVQFVGTQDLGNRLVIAGLTSTHSLVTREYVEKFGTIDEPGKLYCEAYTHNCVDAEACATAKKRGAWAFAHKSIVEHLHPAWRKAPNDDTYRKGRDADRWKIDRALYEERRQKFGLP